MTESTGKRIFHEDIFAEDNEKWSWPLGRSSNVSSENVSNYDIHAGGGKDSCSTPSSEEDIACKGDSTNSLKRSFRKRGSSSASEGNLPEDVSSSPGTCLSSLPHERVLPSMYDDDARSGSPSGVFEKKDLAFRSSFKKEFNALLNKSCDSSPLHPGLEKPEKSPIYDKEDIAKGRRSRNHSPCPISSPKRDSKDALKISSSLNKRSRSHRSRSKSRDSKIHVKSRSRSKERRLSSPKNDSRRSRSRERHNERRRHSKNRRSRSPKGRSRSPKGRSRSPKGRSRSPKVRSRSPKVRSRSPKVRSRSPKVRSRSPKGRSRSPRGRKSHSPRNKRSRSRDVRRKSRSRSYDRHRRRGRRSSSRDRYRRRRYSRSRSRSWDRSKGSNGRKPGSLPLSTSGGTMTPQMALQQTMAAMSAKAQAMTGIALPKYYNPAAVNPLKYAEQVQKRKLLWQTKEKEAEQPKNTVWDKLTFDQDQDGKMTAKFRKLMGIKSEGGGAVEASEQEVDESFLKKQAELFRDLDQQYEMARVTTHTQRGVGLGYSATALYPPVQK